MSEPRIGSVLREAVEAERARESWPTTGFAGVISRTKLADYARHDAKGSQWVSFYYIPDNGTSSEWWGPVTEESATVIRIDLGHRHPTPFLLKFCTGFYRVPGGEA